MATHTEGDDILVHQDNDNHDNDIMDNTMDNTDATGDVTVALGSAGTGGAAGSSPGTTDFNLQVEQNKIPEFFRTKSKDTILAVDFIRLLEDLAKTNQWTDTQTYYHFANSRRNLAREWLSTVVDMDNDEHG
jgi:hypothetical protein